MFDNFITEINSVEVTTLSSVYKLVLSMVLGAVIGYERKRKGQIAGVRTFSLIAMGATLAMILSIYVPQEYLGLKNGDPGRIAAQVVSGIGFLGAGAIIQMKGSVRGLTTAAGIWMVAALGLTVGVGMYVIATVATILILFILWVLERIEHRMSANYESRILNIHTASVVQDITPYRNLLKERHVSLTNFFISVDYEANTSTLNLVVLVPETTDLTDLFNDIRRISPTRGISLANQTTF
ncbi:MAG: MgtC/SapB family protein [Bacteroides sp.]|nr:MgtC/SapB family protein [Bacteroides sp.]MCM1457109.1 MgtC/SapB family protein [Lachnoclostridium sp.]